MLIKRGDTVLSLKDLGIAGDVLVGIFKVENPFQPVAVRVFQLRDSSRTAGDDCVGLIHGIDVVTANGAWLGPAGVFQVAGHAGLPVKVIGLEAILGQPFDGIIHHGGSLPTLRVEGQVPSGGIDACGTL